MASSAEQPNIVRTSAGHDRYPLPAHLDPHLGRVHECWQAMRRAGNSIPFWDDLKLALLGEAERTVMVIDVFENPLRFRLTTIGPTVAARLGGELGGKFLHDLKPKDVLDRFESQCVQTVQSREPTYYASETCSRLVLPLWGNGRVQMLLAAFAGPNF